MKLNNMTLKYDTQQMKLNYDNKQNDCQQNDALKYETQQNATKE
jgi:hypothetical protein